MGEAGRRVGGKLVTGGFGWFWTVPGLVGWLSGCFSFGWLVFCLFLGGCFCDLA